MVASDYAAPAKHHYLEALVMLALAVLTLLAMVEIAGWLDLSLGKAVKMAIAYVIMGGMLIEPYVPGR